MNFIRVGFWVLAGACFLVGMVSSLFFVLLPASLVFGIAGALAARGASGPAWFTPASAGAGISSLALFVVNPGMTFFLATGLVLVVVSAAFLGLSRRHPSRV